MEDKEKIKNLFLTLTKINLKKNKDIFNINEQLNLSSFDISDINLEISMLNKNEYIEYLNSILHHMSSYTEYFNDLAILFGKSIYIFFDCSEVFFIYYKFLELLEESTEYKNTIIYHKSKIIEIYIKYCELFEDENTKKNYIFFINEKLKFLINKPEYNDNNKFFEKFYLKKMLSFDMSNRNFELIKSEDYRKPWPDLQTLYNLDILSINAANISVKAMIITQLLYDINRNMYLSNIKSDIDFLKELLNISENFLLNTIDIIKQVHPLVYLRHASLIECINSIKIINNMESKKDQLNNYLHEIQFLINNKLYIYSTMKFQKTIEQILKIKNSCMFFDININLKDVYVKLISEYKKILVVFDDEKLKVENSWLSEPFNGVAFFIKDENNYYKESIRHLNKCWKLTRNTIKDNCFYIDYII